MSKKVSYFLFILIVAVFFNSIIQPAFQSILKTNKYHVTHIHKTHLLDIKTIDCINETEEDFGEDKLETPLLCSFYLNLDLLNIKLVNLPVGLAYNYHFNKNLYSNVPATIALSIFRI